MTKNSAYSGEPHTGWCKYALCAILLYHGLKQQDDAALNANLNVRINEFYGNLIVEDLGANASMSGEVLRLFIDHRPSRLEACGSGLELERRRRAYFSDRAKFLAREVTTNDHRWRLKAMTKVKLFMVTRTYHRLGCDAPVFANG